MTKKESSFDKIAKAIAYILGALFLGLLTMGIVEVFGDAYNSLHSKPGWVTGIAALITGGILIAVHEHYFKTDRDKDE